MYGNVSKTAFFFLSLLVFTQAWTIKCYCNLTYYDEANSENAGKLVHGPCFVIDRITYYYAFGLNGSLVTQGTDKVREAMINAADRNPCFIDWEKEAKIPTITNTLIDNASYFLIARNCLSIGKEVGSAIVNMMKAGMDLAKTHFVGHSLGAHMGGVAGTQVKALSGTALPRITGCDPAKPGFDDPLPIYKRLSKGNAAYVDTVHTDPKHFAMMAFTADIDISVNPDFYQKNRVQPECKQSTFFQPIIPFTPDDFCSHRRCVDIMVEWISFPYNFPASKAPDVETWVANNGAPIEVTYMGDKVNTSCTGRYYLSTNGHSPFSRGMEGLKPYTTTK